MFTSFCDRYIERMTDHHGGTAPSSSSGDAPSSTALQQFLNWGIFPHPADIEQAISRLQPAEGASLTSSEVIRRLAKTAKVVAAGQGVVASLPGAVPGLGTAAQIAVMSGTAVPETILLLRKMAHLQLCAAHACGKPIRSEMDPDRVHPDRIEEFGVVMGLMTGAILPAKEAAKKFGSKFVTVQISRNLPAGVLRTINRKVGFTLLTKFGTKRGGIALGRVIPLGVGAAIGGTMNYHAVHQFSQSALRFYTENEAYGMQES